MQSLDNVALVKRKRTGSYIAVPAAAGAHRVFAILNGEHTAMPFSGIKDTAGKMELFNNNNNHHNSTIIIIIT